MARELHARIIPDLLEYYQEKKSETTLLILTEGFRSSLTVPLVFGHRCVGFLFLNAKEARAYESQHIPIAERMVAALASSIYHHYVIQLFLAESSKSFVKSMEKKDNETSAHISRMSRYAYAVARCLSHSPTYAARLGPRTLREILWYAPLHDIGKIGIPDAILFKPGSLDKDERGIMETHVDQGAEIVRSLNDGLARYLSRPPFDTALEIIGGHHERWDGTGYPRGISGEAIPVPARIAAVADILDALTSDRPYKRAWTFDQAYEHLGEISGTHLDPAVYGALLECRPEIEAIAAEFTEEH